MSTSQALPSRAARDGFDPRYFPQLFAIEDRHFWFRARNRVIATLVEQLTAGLAPGYRVLEVGCGTGSVLSAVARQCPRGRFIGMDLYGEGLHYAQRRTACPLVQGDVRLPPFKAGFDVIGLFDLLEHVADDAGMLHGLASLLAPGGALLVTVPARASLWSYLDEAAHHCRRYEITDLHATLTAAGYRVEYLTHYMMTIFPLVWVGRRLRMLFNGRSGGGTSADALVSRELQVTPVVNEILTALLTPEAQMIARRRRLPIGSSLLAVARKDDRA